MVPVVSWVGYLIDLDPDLLAGLEFALDEVVVENLLGESLSHSTQNSAFRPDKSSVFL